MKIMKRTDMADKYTGYKRYRYLIFIWGLILLFLGIYLYSDNKKSRYELTSCLEKGETLIDYIKDGHYAYALISVQGTDEYGDFFAVFENTSDGWHRIYEKDFIDYKPWKIDIADIDGDDEEEILIAVRYATLFDKEIKNRMFIFNYIDGVLTKKWTGSQIAGTWREFYAGDVFPAPGCELIFIETVNEGGEQISIYSWFDFGFFMIAESEAYERIENINIIESNRLEVTYRKDKQKHNHILKAADGKLIDEKAEGIVGY